MALAVDEVAMERVKAAEQGSWRDAFRKELAADPGRLPIEAPRALRTSSDLGSGAPPLSAPRPRIDAPAEQCASVSGLLINENCPALHAHSADLAGLHAAVPTVQASALSA